jgi:transcription elongation factor Elf1
VVNRQVVKETVSNELLPCPFCGCKKFDCIADSDSHAAAIYCKECPAGVQHVECTEQQITDAWNRRSPFLVAERVPYAWEVRQGGRTFLVSAQEFTGKTYDAASLKPLFE